jgi:CoA:oxalate CoA-transferase
MNKPLEHLRMIDLTHMLSGPFGTMVLTDLGVETIKIEPVHGGEGTRKLLASDLQNSIDGMGAYFLTLNRGKKSVGLDIKSEEGRAVFNDLVAKSDIVFDNFSPGVTKRLAIDHNTLSSVNPRIITCSVTGFGENGPHFDRPAFDLVAQGIGGGMSITGTEQSGPIRSGIPIGDLGGGIFGVIGVLAAVASREVTGKGQHVDISMLDCQVALLNYMATMYFLSGEIPGPRGNGHFVHVPYGTFPTATDHIIVAVITDGFWQSLVGILDVEELRDEKYAGQPGRLADRDFVEAKVQEALQLHTADYWLEKMQAARIPCAPVNNFAQALSDPQIVARNMAAEGLHHSGRKFRMPGNPVKLSLQKESAFRPAPVLGQDTDAVLGELLGYPAERILRMREKAIVS